MSDSKPYSRLTLRKRLGMELQHQLNKAFVQNHPLTQLFWECTLRCNLHCRHCGSDCRTVAQTPDMPGEDFLRVLDSVAARLNPNGVFVVITGGEPLVRDDLEYWGRKIYDKGFPWGIVTNGLYLTPERYKSLMAAGMHTLTVSLDGLEENHNWMRGNKLSFQRVSQALDILVKDPEIVFDVVTCATQRNFDELPRLKEFLIEKGVHHWRVFDVFPMGRAVENPETLLPNSRFRQLMDFIRDTRREGRIHVEYGCEGFLGNLETEVRDGFFFCKAGICVGSVLADGAISACTSIRSDFHQGNIYHDDFMEVWENRFERFRDREWMRTGLCADCKLFKFCRGNGMHLRDGEGRLLLCHLQRLESPDNP